jgi:hypothetical protein
MESEVEAWKSPPNPTAEVAANPLGFLGQVLIGGLEGAIDADRLAGQQAMVQSPTLPTQISVGGKAILEAAGVVFLGEVPGNRVLQRVSLPEGWQIVPTEHSILSHLVDEKGRKVGDIRYKNDFYDRSGMLSLARDWIKENA